MVALLESPGLAEAEDRTRDKNNSKFRTLELGAPSTRSATLERERLSFRRTFLQNVCWKSANSELVRHVKRLSGERAEKYYADTQYDQSATIETTENLIRDFC